MDELKEANAKLAVLVESAQWFVAASRRGLENYPRARVAVESCLQDLPTAAKELRARAERADELAEKMEGLLVGAELMLLHEDSGGDGWWRGWELLKEALAAPDPESEEPAP